ncbi:MAG: GDP-L-fucose synthase [Thermoanaerobaculia bacterium]|nr:GDP-L-fucose synthase [Thermoanaerobaculia bacterium]
MEREAKIWISGHTGLVGSAIVRQLREEGFENLLLRTHAELDLTRQEPVENFFRNERPDYVIHAAGRVGGIHANATQQAQFLYENLLMAAHVIHAAAELDVRKLLFLGSSCIYPRDAEQPMREDALLTGPLEPTNEGYALAKIAGLKLCEHYQRQFGKRFVSVMPTNLYGPGDNFHPLDSHVIPGMMRRFHEAKESGAGEVIVWGSGTPRREFLYVDDLARAIILLMETYEDAETINVGTGSDVTIRELAETMKDVVGFEGELRFDRSRPDGPPRKLLDTTRINALGWHPKVELREGLEQTYAWAVEHAL